MAQIVVRKLESDVKDKLARQAREHGRSMEEEVRAILRAAVAGNDTHGEGLGTRIARRFAEIGFTDDEVASLELRGGRLHEVSFDE